MTNLFVADRSPSATDIGNIANTNTNAMFDDMDLDVCLKHPRVTKVTIMPDGTLVAELSAPAKADGIIRKTEGLHKANKTGFRGVSDYGDKYKLQLQIDGKQRYLGTFDTIEAAVTARVKAEIEAGL